jgi:glycosyltransferase involved in cell wall biosynthesis
MAAKIAYKIVFYCPDQHIEYDLSTLDEVGVGGGITARVRIAHALAKQGHRVFLYGNCPKNATIQGVVYTHFSQMKNVDTDIFIAATSGGSLDLRPLSGHEIRARIKILMIQGIALPKNPNFDDFDVFYVPSNFIRSYAIENWKLPPEKFFVSYLGITNENYRRLFPVEKDPHALIYCGHPIKGLGSAIAVLRNLRKVDPGYSLHVFGGYRLWGNIEQPTPFEPGVVDHGLTGQKKLAHAILKMSYSLNLQEIPEAFGMSVTESMRGGSIVLASPVGAFPEIVRDGYNGFLVPGVHTEADTRDAAAELILNLDQNPGYRQFVRNNAIHTPMSWQTVAKTWEGHWDYLLNRIHSPESRLIQNRCSSCQGDLLPLSDGDHCIRCGSYQPCKSFSPELQKVNYG